MTRERSRICPGLVPGHVAKQRHMRVVRGKIVDQSVPLPRGLVARPERPLIQSKHQSYFEFVENKDKKKKLEFEFTYELKPPPGFDFVPAGNPALTRKCKELSRNEDVLILIVVLGRGDLSRQLNRIGHHFRQKIVAEALHSLGEYAVLPNTVVDGARPEPIPKRQEDINKQADAAIQDLFPRIPNTDREMIIQHAFSKSTSNNGDPPVGLAANLTLSCRAQLAVLAHIRHKHTRYDRLLREAGYLSARKAVQQLCLDLLVKWRGDEETGRDQLDEILREVVVISDSDGDEAEDGDSDSVSDSDGDGSLANAGTSLEECADLEIPDLVVPDQEVVSLGISKVDAAKIRSGTDVSLTMGRKKKTTATLPTVHLGHPGRLGRANGENDQTTGPKRKARKKSRKKQRLISQARRKMKKARANERHAGRVQETRKRAWNEAIERQRLYCDDAPITTKDGLLTVPASQGRQAWQLTGHAPTCTGERQRQDVHSKTTIAQQIPAPFWDCSTSLGQPAFGLSAASRDQRPPFNIGYGPIFASRAGLASDGMQRVSDGQEDLKDDVIESIEQPAALGLSRHGSSATHPAFAFSERSPELNDVHVPDGGYRRLGLVPEAVSQGLYVSLERETFIKLPPRDRSRMHGAGWQAREVEVRMRSRTHALPSVYNSLTGGPAGYSHVPSSDVEPLIRPDGPCLGSADRPILVEDGGNGSYRTGDDLVWIGHDRQVLDEVSRPAWIDHGREIVQDQYPGWHPQDDGAPSSKHPSTQASTHLAALAPDTTESYSQRPIHVSDHDRCWESPLDCPSTRRARGPTLRDFGVIRVQNAFPPQHGSRTISVGHESYGTEPMPRRYTMAERVTQRIERPTHDHAHFQPYSPVDPYSAYQQRREGIRGVEYVPVGRYASAEGHGQTGTNLAEARVINLDQSSR